MLERLVKSILVVAIAAIFIGADRPETSLHGTWSIDLDKMIEKMKADEDYKQASPEEKKLMEDGLRQGMAGATLRFSPEGKLTFQSGEKKEEVTYKFVSKEGDRWKIETTEMTEGTPKTEIVTIVWADDDHISIVGAEGDDALYLMRKK